LPQLFGGLVNPHLLLSFGGTCAHPSSTLVHSLHQKHIHWSSSCWRGSLRVLWPFQRTESITKGDRAAVCDLWRAGKGFFFGGRVHLKLQTRSVPALEGGRTLSSEIWEGAEPISVSSGTCRRLNYHLLSPGASRTASEAFLVDILQAVNTSRLIREGRVTSEQGPRSLEEDRTP
jgi:hypothetical protein